MKNEFKQFFSEVFFDFHLNFKKRSSFAKNIDQKLLSWSLFYSCVSYNCNFPFNKIYTNVLQK